MGKPLAELDDEDDDDDDDPEVCGVLISFPHPPFVASLGSDSPA